MGRYVRKYTTISLPHYALPDVKVEVPDWIRRAERSGGYYRGTILEHFRRGFMAHASGALWAGDEPPAKMPDSLAGAGGALMRCPGTYPGRHRNAWADGFRAGEQRAAKLRERLQSVGILKAGR